ncbi:protein of unknown function [Candidatus Nitrosocaldus cavascurensis]|uniref:Uncharacterized protein n=1 Tax=Candidatus Nitrosocaldus cavascurensis TaxID=2058097 RepID=A0A2K5ARL2_9ARCH|nr:protein of unknown function [Candidatus Nitrosocaldus cavascurensis]
MLEEGERLNRTIVGLKGRFNNTVEGCSIEFESNYSRIESLSLLSYILLLNSV